MDKEAMFSAINAKYDELKSALEGDDLGKTDDWRHDPDTDDISSHDVSSDKYC